MNLLNFISKYPDENNDKHKLNDIRDKKGIICRHCGSKDDYWKSDKWQFECKKCKTRTTLHRSMVMHSFQIPFRYWFVTMYLLTFTKKSFSVVELHRQLGYKYYEPIWKMLLKLRLPKGKKVGQYRLSGQIGLDEGFFSTKDKPEEIDKPGKRVRGNQKKIKALVIAESKEVEGKSTRKRKTRNVRFIKMQVIPDLKAEIINVQFSTNTSKE